MHELFTMQTVHLAAYLAVQILFCWGLCPVNECQCDNIELRVDCLGMSLEEIPITLNPHIQTLKIRNGQLKRLDASLQFYPQLKILDLGSNLIDSIPPQCFTQQQGLTHLYLNNNSIAIIASQAFLGLAAVTKLSLKANVMTTLEPKQFSGLVGLRELDLSENQITLISKDAFEGLPSLEILHLDRNRLASLPIDSFVKIKNLRSLLMAHNTLHASTLLKSVWNDGSETALSKLRLLDLSYSHLARMELCHILNMARNLQTLIFVGNNADQLSCIESNVIRTLELGDVDTLKRLDAIMFYSMSELQRISIVRANNLVTVERDVFYSNSGLERINLSDNPKLEEISLETFSTLPKLKSLLLSNNSLTTITYDKQSNLTQTRFLSLEEMDLSNNPLDCNCTMKWIGPAMSLNLVKCTTTKQPSDVFQLKNIITGDLTCLSPHTLKVIFLGTLTFIIMTVVPISVAIHVIHIRRNRHDRFVKIENSSLFMSFRHPNSKVVTEDMVTHPTLMSSIAWNEALTNPEFKMSSSELRPQHVQKMQNKNNQIHIHQPVQHLQPQLLHHQQHIYHNHHHHHQQQHPHNYESLQEPVTFMNVYSSSPGPYHCDFSFPSRNWS